MTIKTRHIYNISQVFKKRQMSCTQFYNEVRWNMETVTEWSFHEQPCETKCTIPTLSTQVHNCFILWRYWGLFFCVDGNGWFSDGDSGTCFHPLLLAHPVLLDLCLWRLKQQSRLSFTQFYMVNSLNTSKWMKLCIIHILKT